MATVGFKGLIFNTSLVGYCIDIDNVTLILALHVSVFCVQSCCVSMCYIFIISTLCYLCRIDWGVAETWQHTTTQYNMICSVHLIRNTDSAFCSNHFIRIPNEISRILNHSSDSLQDIAANPTYLRNLPSCLSASHEPQCEAKTLLPVMKFTDKGGDSWKVTKIDVLSATEVI